MTLSTLLLGRSKRHLCSRLPRFTLDMDMTCHFCTPPTKASSESHETAAQRFAFVSSSMTLRFTIWNGSFEETPKLCLVSCQNHMKPQILKYSEEF